MPKSTFKLTFKDEALDALIAQADHRMLGIWARDCAERVMPYFEQSHPDDPRPRQALITLQNWIDTGAFSMKVIRKASLDSHAAARDVGADNPARAAARAAGQAVATAHVWTHAVGPSLYALQAIHRASSDEEADAAITQERAWQYQRLMDLIAQESN